MTTSSTPQNASLASLAHVHTQARQYADQSVEALHKRVNAIQSQLLEQAERREARVRRFKLVDRCVFLILGATVTKLLDAAVLPAVAVFCLGLSPDIGRELFEFFKRL